MVPDLPGAGPVEPEVLAGCCLRAWAFGICDQSWTSQWVSALVAGQSTSPVLLEASLIRLALRPCPVAAPEVEKSLIRRLVEALADDGHLDDGPAGRDTRFGDNRFGDDRFGDGLPALVDRLGRTIRTGSVYADWVGQRLEGANGDGTVLCRPTRNPRDPLPLLVLFDRCLRLFPASFGLVVVPAAVSLVLAEDPSRDVVPVDDVDPEVVETAASLASDRSGPLASVPQALRAAQLLAG